MPRPKKAAGEKYIRQDISMEPKQYKRLMEECQQQDRPVSWIVRKALDDYFMCNATH